MSGAQCHETLGIIGGAGVAAAARLDSDVAAGFRNLHGRLPTIALWNLPFSDDLEHAGVVESLACLAASCVERLAPAEEAAAQRPR